MQPARFRPGSQIFVCVHARASGDPLASGCGTEGPLVYAALKRAVSAAGRTSDVWVTRTLCLGHCPARGCSVTAYPAGAQWVGVTESDVPDVVFAATRVAIR